VKSHVFGAWAVVAIAGCGGNADQAAPPPVKPPPAPPTFDPDDDHPTEIAPLLAFEDQQRKTIDFGTLPGSDVSLGPDPYRIAKVGAGWAGLLRGASAIVLLDDEAHELARVATPRSPSGIAVSAAGDILVVGEGAREIAHYRVDGGAIARVSTIAVDALGMRGIALAPDAKTAYVVEERDGRLLAVSLAKDGKALKATATKELGRCHGPSQVEAIEGHVVVDCMLDHTLEIRRGTDVTRIHHDGPIWSFAIQRETEDGGVLIAAGGVEDHPLLREEGGFGFIDSFVYLYRLAPKAEPTRLAAVNVSELGLVTPKWIGFQSTAPVKVRVAGYASPDLMTLSWQGSDFASTPVVSSMHVLPGISSVAVDRNGAAIAANPLFDGWIVTSTARTGLVPVQGSKLRAVESRVGELLFYTAMMAPWNKTEGKLSRFTCETCHHEGYVDGRTHFTGRSNEAGDKIHATTRTLYGLANNRPYFSRALDKTMAEMVHAEFRVANRHNGRDPWFALTDADLPWLHQVEGAPARLAPDYLRKSFMQFLFDQTHRANPAALGRDRFTERERAGARVFRDRCASCHAPRLISDVATTAVPFDRWESLVLSPNGPLVWSNAEYGKTGVVPYVNPSGSRVPALRRLYKKWPYFTTGSAKSLGDVLDRYAEEPRSRSESAANPSAPVVFHDNAPAAAKHLAADDKTALLAFLQLL
jgi:hypothetical protein